MENVNISGYVYTKDERFMDIYLAPFAVVVIWIMAVILWVNTFRDIRLLYFTIPWTALAVYLVISARWVHMLAHMRFQTESLTIRNTWPKGEVSLTVSEETYVSCITCEVAFGKGVVKRSYYLFSPTAIEDKHIEYEGTNWIRRLNRYGIVIIPKNQETEEWVTSVWKLVAVPAYPKQRQVRG